MIEGMTSSPFPILGNCLVGHSVLQRLSPPVVSPFNASLDLYFGVMSYESWGNLNLSWPCMDAQWLRRLVSSLGFSWNSKTTGKISFSKFHATCLVHAAVVTESNMNPALTGSMRHPFPLCQASAGTLFQQDWSLH